jgi:hypothetical protein
MTEYHFHEHSPYVGEFLLNQSVSIMIGFRKVVQTIFSHNLMGLVESNEEDY